MTQNSPLAVCLLTDESETIAERLDAHRIVIEDGQMMIYDAREQRASAALSLPEKIVSLQQMAKGSVVAWNNVLDTLLSQFSAPPHILLEFNHPMRELFLLGSRQGRLRYSLFVAEVKPRLSPIDYAVISAALKISFESEHVEAAFREVFVGSYYDAKLFANDLQKDIEGATDPRLRLTRSEGRRFRVLVVAYFAGPCTTVGAKRVNYWFEQMGPASDNQIDVELVSAMPYKDPPGRHHYVPNYHLAEILDAGAPSAWQLAFMKTEAEQSRTFSTLSYYWRLGLERYFDSLDDRFDAVIISGNPFSVFDFANYARRRWGACVILDYRDPFAFNPRINYSSDARQVAAYVERGFNYQAALITTVNEECTRLVAGPIDARIAVIPNGYDEKVLDQIISSKSSADHITFVYAGSVYPYGSPTPLVKALDPKRHRFIFVGNSSGLDPELSQHPSVTVHGPMDYDKAMTTIASGNIGVVFVSESAFESSTKIFDYIGLDLDVLVCTNGPIHGGQIGALLEGLEGVYWCKNTPEDLRSFVEHYVPTGGARVDQRSRFSRRHALEKLIDEIRNLC